MNYQLREGYLTMTNNNHAAVAPVGIVWKTIRDSFPAMNLYQSDGSHPLMPGTYIAACTFYASIYRKSPVGLSYTAGLPAADAAAIQRIAARVVFDSLPQWHIGDRDPSAAFTGSNNANIFTGRYTGTSRVRLSWDFGDGHTGIGININHTYTTTGTYTVRLTATDSCGRSATSTRQVNILNLGISALEQEKNDFIVYPVPTSQQIDILLQALPNDKISAEIFTIEGQLMLQKQISSVHETIDIGHLSNGIYFIRIGSAVKRLEIIH
jgi:hypothetical protein